MSNPDPMNNESGKSQNISISKKNLVLMIIAIILAVCICTVAVVAVIFTIRNDNPTEPSSSVTDTAALAEAARNTVAITVGDHQLSAVELNYFYVEIINNFCNDYYYYIYYYGMIDTAKPLNEQYFDEENGTTWADYFLSLAENNIKSTYMLYDLAVAEGTTLTDDQKENLNTVMETITQSAASYNYDSADSYLENIFGYGADLESYRAYCERSVLADAYYSQYANSLTYTDDQLREYEAKAPHQYNSYNYAVYYLQASKFLSGGTEGSDGEITYTDEQIAASIAAATEAANALKGSSCDSVDSFKAMILGMDIHSNLDSVSVTEKTDTFYSSIDASFQEWMIAEDRTYGDVTVVAKTVTGEDEEEVIDGYYILWYGGLNDNTLLLKDVRHVLVLFKNADGKTYSDGITSFTEDQKNAAKAAAEALLEQWKTGEMTEDTFAALATEKTEDPGSASTGGLYEYVYPGQMVESFESWCYDESRQPGDTGLVESVYGYHIMYFVGDSDMNYRDYMITYNKRSEDLKAWHDALVESAELTEVCLDYCELDMKLSG